MDNNNRPVEAQIESIVRVRFCSHLNNKIGNWFLWFRRDFLPPAVGNAVDNRIAKLFGWGFVASNWKGSFICGWKDFQQQFQFEGHSNMGCGKLPGGTVCSGRNEQCGWGWFSFQIERKCLWICWHFNRTYFKSSVYLIGLEFDMWVTYVFRDECVLWYMLRDGKVWEMLRELERNLLGSSGFSPPLRRIFLSVTE